MRKLSSVRLLRQQVRSANASNTCSANMIGEQVNKSDFLKKS